MKQKAFNAAGALLFAGFTSLQLNDLSQYGNRDPWIWLLLYGALAVLNAVNFKQPLPFHVLTAAAGFYWGCLLFRLQDSAGSLHLEWLSPSAFSHSDPAMVQLSNESGGLLIAAIWVSAMVFLARMTK